MYNWRNIGSLNDFEIKVLGRLEWLYYHERNLEGHLLETKVAKEFKNEIELDNDGKKKKWLVYAFQVWRDLHKPLWKETYVSVVDIKEVISFGRKTNKVFDQSFMDGILRKRKLDLLFSGVGWSAKKVAIIAPVNLTLDINSYIEIKEIGDSHSIGVFAMNDKILSNGQYIARVSKESVRKLLKISKLKKELQ